MDETQRLRLVTFVAGGGPPRIGAVTAAGRVVEFAAAARTLGESPLFDPADMTSLIAAGAAALAQARRLAAAPGDGPALDAVHLLAPVPKPPRNVYCVGWNYLEHVKEGEAMRMKTAELPDHPIFFTKGTGAVNGPFDPIPFDPMVSTCIDWEVELAAVIGRRGRNIAEAEAMDAVFGYTVINDVTARDIQQKKHGGQWFKGKSLDGHAPMGPWIVPAADLDPAGLRLVTRVNGEVKQDGNTRQMHFKLPRIIAELSLGLTLEPGDIVATGTPPGIGGARNPPEYLKAGDVLETEIVGIGTLRNPVQAV